jgi:hypothetical protein
VNEELIKRIDEYLQTTVGALEARDILRDCRAALSQSEPVRYVPMTDAEWEEIMREFNAPASGMNPYDADYGYHEERHIEAAVIRRAGLEVQE